MRLFSRLLDRVVKTEGERAAEAESAWELRTPGTTAWARDQLANMVVAGPQYVGALEYQGTLDEVLTYIEQRGTTVTQLASSSPRGIPCMAFVPTRDRTAYCVVSGPETKWRAGDCYMVWTRWEIVRPSKSTFGCKLDEIDVLD